MSIKTRIESLEEKATYEGVKFVVNIPPRMTREEWTEYAREFTAAGGFTVNLNAAEKQTMNLQGRVEKLEQQHAAPGDCELCARVETRLILPRADGERWEETDRVPIASKCPKCGRAREVVMRVVMPRASEAGGIE